MKKEYAEKNHEHPWLEKGTMFSFAATVALLIVLLIIPGVRLEDMRDRISLLEAEISTMPHYECWNATFKSMKNLSEVSCATPILQGDALRSWCNEFTSVPFRKYEVECFKDANKCYIEEVKEVCEIIKLDAYRA